MNDFIGMDAMVMAMAFASFGKKRRMRDDPEYAAKEEERLAKAREDKYNAEYAQAHLDHEEYSRNPRAFLRRLSRTLKEI